MNGEGFYKEIPKPGKPWSQKHIQRGSGEVADQAQDFRAAVEGCYGKIRAVAKDLVADSPKSLSKQQIDLVVSIIDEFYKKYPELHSADTKSNSNYIYRFLMELEKALGRQLSEEEEQKIMDSNEAKLSN